MIYAGRSDCGIRTNNEDAILIRDGSPALLAVSDGMGGHACGEVASALVMESLQEAKIPARADNAARSLSKAVMDANVAVYRMAAASAERKGMGATLVCVVLYEDRAICANVGDSRLYHFTEGVLKQVTKDQSYVQSLVDAGIITREQALVHPRRNVILQAMGVELSVHPDLYDLPLRKDDMLLLCSDGLSSSLSEEKMTAILLSSLSAREKADALVRAAIANGSMDNVSVVIAVPEEVQA